MPITTNMKKAVEVLREGGLVAFPTETVYGLGGDAANETAIRKIFAAKNRPFNHPLIVHIADASMLNDWAIDISEDALKLAQIFWPGPLTLILKKQPSVLDVVTAGQSTIGLRVPKHPVAHSLLKAFGGGVAAPSANQFTHISPTTSQAVLEELGDKVDLILEGGACEVGLESTILDMSSDQPTIMRPGMITAEAIASVLQKPVKLFRKDIPDIRTPGMHHLHYAPSTETVLIDTQHIASYLKERNELAIAVVAYSPIKANAHIVQMPKDSKQYAHTLYQTLRDLDNQHYYQILIEEVPKDLEWEAINDRLLKACRTRI